jgi:site-specific DNA-methyltransferase (adenine-specific)
MSVKLHEGECLDVIKTLPDHSIHSIVTDPPYGLSFMGRKWDYDVPSKEIWIEVMRVLKPGGYLLSFSGTRTYHRMAVEIEDAGFEIRDQIGWLYGSGFPKSHNLDGDWDGWGTALKPAWESIVVARKPIIGTVAANVMAHGTGAMNIDACRIWTEIRTYDLKGGENLNKLARHSGGDSAEAKGCGAYGVGAKQVTNGTATVVGRWPANVIHDGSDEVMDAFAAFGERAPGNSNGGASKGEASRGSIPTLRRGSLISRDDTGTAARFFYCAKASKADRAGSKHPTVKPVSLMRYLCRLVTPKGGTILDPFAGSGTTGQAAVEEGFDAVLIEREAEYCEDIRHRLALFLDHAKA